jgi:hypothetical protein
MVREKLRIELTDKERAEWSDSVAYQFAVTVEGDVVVYEEWEDMDELFGNGYGIRVPARVWREAMPWIEAQLRTLA